MSPPLEVRLGIKNLLLIAVIGVAFAVAKVVYDDLMFALYLQDVVVGDVFNQAKELHPPEMSGYISQYSYPVSARVVYVIGLGVVVLMVSAMAKLWLRNTSNPIIYVVAVMSVWIPYPTRVVEGILRGGWADGLTVMIAILMNLICAALGVRLVGLLRAGKTKEAYKSI